MRSKSLFLSVLVSSALSGCGNAFESVDIGPWQDAGTREAPVPRFAGDVAVKTTFPGTGQVIEAGDLVQLKVTVSKIQRESRIDAQGTKTYTHYTLTRHPKVLWVWTGREPAGSGDYYADVMSWGNLGAARVRRALIGHRLGETIEIRAEEPFEEFDALPVRGLSLQPSRMSTLFPNHGNPWPHVVVANYSRSEPTWSTFEILKVCRGHLYRRTAQVTQWGQVANQGDMNYANSRRGTLHWNAVEGDCGSGQEKVRMETGPLYFARYEDAHRLYNWTDTYSKYRPREKYPQDYAYEAYYEKDRKEAEAENAEMRDRARQHAGESGRQ